MDALSWIDGAWQSGNPKLLGACDHATWLSSIVFDGARAFGGLAPDLALHAARAIRSAEILDMRPTVNADTIVQIAWDGIGQFPPDAELYIRPLFFATSGHMGPDPATTRFALTLEVSPLPAPTGFSATLSPLYRPDPRTAPTEAKAAGLYAQVGRISNEAEARGFDTAVVRDLDGHVAEFAAANLFIVKDGVVHTPVHNRTFLNGLTRQRVIKLLRADGVQVVERSLTFAEVQAADEVFSTGNYGKVLPCTRIEDRDFRFGPVTMRARDLYFDFAEQARCPSYA